MIRGLPLMPGATLGVLGGGQLARMFVHAAQRMGYFTVVLDPDVASPAGRVSHHFIQTDYIDIDGLARLAGLADAITTEFENVPAPSLDHLAAARPVSPAAAAVAIAQDRIAEKAHFIRCGVPCAPYAVLESADQLDAVSDDLLPGILKTARLGYDGKGQRHVTTRAELADAWADTGSVACVLEKRLQLEFECSVIVARGHDGQVVNFPACMKAACRPIWRRVPSPRPSRSPPGSTMSACCASSSSCWPTARWWSMKWRRASTIRGIGPLMAQ